MPIFKVWFPDNGQSKDDATTVKAFDHEDAAARWADWYDNYSSDFLIVGGQPADVLVLGDGEVEPKSLTVMGYQTRQYMSKPSNTDFYEQRRSLTVHANRGA